MRNVAVSASPSIPAPVSLIYVGSKNLESGYNYSMQRTVLFDLQHIFLSFLLKISCCSHIGSSGMIMPCLNFYELGKCANEGIPECNVVYHELLSLGTEIFQNMTFQSEQQEAVHKGKGTTKQNSKNNDDKKKFQMHGSALGLTLTFKHQNDLMSCLLEGKISQFPSHEFQELLLQKRVLFYIIQNTYPARTQRQGELE